MRNEVTERLQAGSFDVGILGEIRQRIEDRIGPPALLPAMLQVMHQRVYARAKHIRTLLKIPVVRKIGVRVAAFAPPVFQIVGQRRHLCRGDIGITLQVISRGEQRVRIDAIEAWVFEETANADPPDLWNLPFDPGPIKRNPLAPETRSEGATDEGF
jgi:hypothetical protein